MLRGACFVGAVMLLGLAQQAGQSLNFHAINPFLAVAAAAEPPLDDPTPISLGQAGLTPRPYASAIRARCLSTSRDRRSGGGTGRSRACTRNPACRSA